MLTKKCPNFDFASDHDLVKREGGEEERVVVSCPAPQGLENGENVSCVKRRSSVFSFMRYDDVPIVSIINCQNIIWRTREQILRRAPNALHHGP